MKQVDRTPAFVLPRCTHHESGTVYGHRVSKAVADVAVGGGEVGDFFPHSGPGIGTEDMDSTEAGGQQRQHQGDTRPAHQNLAVADDYGGPETGQGGNAGARPGIRAGRLRRHWCHTQHYY